MKSSGSCLTKAQRTPASPVGVALAVVPVDLASIPAMPDGLDWLPEAAWCSSLDGAVFVGNACWHAATGMGQGPFALADWLGAVHADDRSDLAGGWATSVAAGTSFEAVVRYRRGDGSFAWWQVRAAPVRDDVGVPSHWIGVGTDIDRLKRSEAQAVLIADELAHRIGNIFAVVGGMLALSAREQPKAAPFATSISARIAALATAHTFIWPPTRGGDAAPQHAGALIDVLLRPYATPDGPTIDISGDGDVITGAAATCVTLVIHELATNAAKFGALSCSAGRLAIRLRRTSTHLTIVWAEQGGPAVPHPPTRSGFGTGLIARVTRSGQVARSRRWWRRDGLLMVLRLTM